MKDLKQLSMMPHFKFIPGPAMTPPKTALSGVSKAVNSLLDRNRPDLAQKLALAAARKFPDSEALAKLLEKAVSCASDIGAVEKIYGEILKSGRAYPGHYYHLGMFYKRAGEFSKMKRAFSGFLSCRGRADLIHTYIACCTLDKYDQAFETAERILDSPEHDRVLSRLWNPWGDRSTPTPSDFFAGRLTRLEHARIRKELEHYRVFLRGALLFFSGRLGEAVLELGKLPVLSPERYGWMHFPAGWALLYSCDFRGALDRFRLSARSEVSRIPSMGRIAEIYICTGRSALGFSELRKALKSAPFGETAGLRSWEGEMRLFTGDYKGALNALTAGAKLGDDVALCWRGAAYAKLGMLENALEDLNMAVKLFPTDLEARVWRAETLRLAGKLRPALPDLDFVIASDDKYVWAYFNRALVRHALGDQRGMKEDFKKIDGGLRRFIGSRLSAEGRKMGGAARMLAILEEGCRLAMGNRRADRYFYPIWMGNSPVRGRSGRGR